MDGKAILYETIEMNSGSPLSSVCKKNSYGSYNYNFCEPEMIEYGWKPAEFTDYYKNIFKRFETLVNKYRELRNAHPDDYWNLEEYDKVYNEINDIKSELFTPEKDLVDINTKLTKNTDLFIGAAYGCGAPAEE